MLTFQHQRVYDPISEAIVHLSDLSGLTDDDDSDFLGPYPYIYPYIFICKGISSIVFKTLSMAKYVQVVP